MSLQSIVQFEGHDGAAEIVAITHEVLEGHFRQALGAIESLTEV